MSDILKMKNVDVEKFGAILVIQDIHLCKWLDADCQ